METVVVHSLSEMHDFAKDFLQELQTPTHGATVVCLQGDLGAGKTTLTQMIARELGIIVDVVSPTFVVMKVYQLTVESPETEPWQRLVHIDAYRLTNGDDLLKLRFAEYLENPDNLIIIEWPELVESALPTHRTEVIIEIGEGDDRRISVVEHR